MLTLAQIGAIVGTGWVVFGLGILYNDVINQPTIHISIEPEQAENSTSKAIVTVANDGRKPATNIILTLKPNSDIISYEPTFYTEEVKLDQPESKLLVAKMNRLVHGSKIEIVTSHNTTNDRLFYDVYATYDQGTTHEVRDPNRIVTETKSAPITDLLIAIAGFAALSFGAELLRRLMRAIGRWFHSAGPQQ